MKKIFIPTAILLLVLPVISGCGGTPSGTEQVEHTVMSYSLQGESSDFGFGLFQQVASADYSQNIVLSPLSARLALAMAYNGAVGETKEAMAKVLDLEGMSLEEVNGQLHNLMASLQQADEAVLLEIANSLWVDGEERLDPGFEQRCRESYGAEMASLDLGDPASIERINAWVSEETHGRIEKIVGEGDDAKGLLALVLLNAVYFNGKWAMPFDPSLNADGDFHLLDGGTATVPLMHAYGNFNYYGNDDLQAVSLPYGEGRLSMYVFLPREGRDYGEFLRSLNEGAWENWMDELQFSSIEGELALPRFRVEYEKELNEALKAMGMGPAFEEGLDGMFRAKVAGPTWIDKVLQKTFIDVNEEGTEAAAVTMVEVKWAGISISEPFQMIVDRPFFFAIRDNQTGALIFMGSIVDPS